MKADALIFDSWSDEFQKQINPEERELRNVIRENMRLSSGPSRYHSGFGELQSHSECLISLLTDPCWLDVEFVEDRIGFEIPLEEQGSFNILVEKSIETLIKYFDEK